MRMRMLTELEPGMVLAKDVYSPEDHTTPVIRSGMILNDYVIKQIKSRGISSIYVDDADELPADGSTVNLALQQRLLDPELQEKAIVTIQQVIAIALEGLQADSAQRMSELVTIVGRIVQSILNDNTALVNINTMKSLDDYLDHHSLSVTVLSAAIGHHLGFDTQQLNKLAFCAALHDVGKALIPVDIIEKTTKLDPSELSLVKTHPAAGYQFLKDNGIGDEEIWGGVLYHHEKVDGTGYPTGLPEAQIPLFARIIAVADVYDALTSNRPYRKPMEAPDALEYIMGGVGTSFSYDIVDALVQKIDLYPVGSKVMLSNYKVATIINNEMQLRPVVRVDDSGEVLDLFRDRDCLSLVIRKVYIS